MNKRSAVLMALGLTAALIAGGMALAAGAGPSVGQASTGDATRSTTAEPVVRTRSRTVTIHRQADGSGGTIAVDGSTTSGAASISAGTDDGQHDMFDDHGGADVEDDLGGDHDDDSGSGSDDSGHGDDDSGHGGGDDDDE